MVGCEKQEAHPGHSVFSLDLQARMERWLQNRQKASQWLQHAQDPFSLFSSFPPLLLTLSLLLLLEFWHAGSHTGSTAGLHTSLLFPFRVLRGTFVSGASVSKHQIPWGLPLSRCVLSEPCRPAVPPRGVCGVSMFSRPRGREGCSARCLFQLWKLLVVFSWQTHPWHPGLHPHVAVRLCV